MMSPPTAPVSGSESDTAVALWSVGTVDLLPATDPVIRNYNKLNAEIIHINTGKF